MNESTMTIYTPEFYENQIKEEKERMELARKPIPEYTAEEVKKIYKTPEEYMYAQMRLKEFNNYAKFTLHRRLQPGYAKVGKRIFLGQCPPPLFHHWFGYICGGQRKQRVKKVKIDGLRYPNRIFYYSWPNGTLPRFNTPEQW
jgi:hypothetical protein